MEKAVFGMDTLNITQGMNGNYTHQGVLSLDVAGKDTGIESMRAPFTGTIKRIYNGYVVWLESNERVKYADGTEDYMTVMTMHDNDVSDLKVGQVIKQGQIYFQEGTRGNATGNHIHLACGKGKFTGTGWYKNKEGNWCINNQYDVSKALYLLNNCVIKNSGGYNWIKTDNYIYQKGTKYRVHLLGGAYLPFISGYNDRADGYAGIYGKFIDGVQIENKTYQVHLKGTDKNNWLSYVTGYGSGSNGYAGIYGKAIDGIRIKNSTYRVHTKKHGWLDWVSKADNTNEGYAGIYGYEIDGLQIK